MQKFRSLCLVAAAALLGGVGNAALYSPTGAGTSTVGTSGDYATLGDAFTAINNSANTSITVTNKALTGNIATLTLASNPYIVGQQITVALSPADPVFDGTYRVRAVSGSDVSYSKTNADVPGAATGGLVTSVQGARDASQWILEIVSDTTEATNITLGCTVASGGSILIRPAAATQPTITFTATTDNAGPSGHMLIGLTTNAAWAMLPTENVTIDGSNNGTTTRDLTITNTAANAHTFASPLGIIGNSHNFTVKNTRLINAGSGAGSNSAFNVRARNGAETGTANFFPNNFQIINCELTVTNSSQGHGINITPSGTIVAGNASSGFLIKDNDINARIRGIFVNNGYGYTVEGNRITVAATAPVTTLDTWGLFNNSANTPPAHTTVVRNNRIFVTNASTTTTSSNGIHLATVGTGYDRVMEVYNNEVILENTGARAAAAAVANHRGIGVTSGVTSKIYNNTVVILENTAKLGPMATGNTYAIGGPAAAAHNMDIRNNVIVVNEPNVVGIHQGVADAGVGSGYTSNFNIVSTNNGALFGRVGTTNHATMADWRTATSRDANSDNFNPTARFASASAPYNLTLVGAPLSAAGWGGDPATLTLVPTDYAGATRNGTRPYRGFHEPAAAPTNTTPSAVGLSPDSVASNAANGTAVGTLSATDNDEGDSLVFALTNNAGGAFALSSGNVIEVANNTLLTTPTINIEVTATDEIGAVATQTIAVTVTGLPSSVPDWQVLQP